ncbi:unnamed protein product [Caenorhabditis auriculariae]|uniref:Amidase domain-containing protein n=1 Tax=Caenorhabditis auriculariae TaxID=2777116 RepID=A0A8S1HT68_9PELO|nr:unnamed protein product [Caenorhabditis auriculariae]
MLVTTEGPMAPNISACINYMRTIWSDEKFFASDPFVPPVPWQEHLYSSEKTLNIGFYTFDGYSEPPPAYQRAVLDTVALLRSQGHNLVEFQVPRPAEAFELFVASSTGDGGTFLKQKLDLAVLEAMPKNCVELRETFAKIEEYRHDFVRAMRRQNLDAIVCPAFGSIAPHVGKANDMISATCYTSLYNLIDFPAGVVQVTRVSKKDESEVREMPDVDKWAKMTRDECNNSVGLPISVQIAAPPFREELCLRLLRDVEKTS